MRCFLGTHWSIIAKGEILMHIVCCFKQLPDTTQVKTNPASSTLIRIDIKPCCNPYDLVAAETAVSLLKNRERCTNSWFCGNLTRGS